MFSFKGYSNEEDKLMAFARHETFHFREGWLTKGIKAVVANEDIFMRKDAMELLGIGSNMVKALRYWMQATKLTEENPTGKKYQKLTSFGGVISEYDRYLEEEITLWLIHYHLATNKDLATTWYWFFNIFTHKEFDEDIFLTELDYWVKEQGEEVSLSSLKKDFDLLINTYCSTKNISANPEDNLACPLQELGIIELMDGKRKRYRFGKTNTSELPLELFVFALADYMDRKGLEKDVDLEGILSEETGLGRVFVLGLADVIRVLERMELKGFIKVNKTAGLNHISVKEELKPYQILESYYKACNFAGDVGVIL